MTPIALLLLAAASALNLVQGPEPGIPLHIIGTVCDRDARPVAGAALHVYQTDASGRYTPDNPMDEAHARLSGRLTADAEGHFEIRTIRPGGYPNPTRVGGSYRYIPPHVHIDVTAKGHPERLAQVVFADDPHLQDPYWQRWVKKLGQPVASVDPEGDGLVAHVTVTLE